MSDWPTHWSWGQHVVTTDHEVAGLIPGTSTNFKCGLGLEEGPCSLTRTIRMLLDWGDWLRKSTLDLMEHYANHIIPSYSHLPVSCWSLVDRCGSLGSCKPQIYYFVFKWQIPCNVSQTGQVLWDTKTALKSDAIDENNNVEFCQFCKLDPQILKFFC